MSLTKSARFPNRVEKRRRVALTAREANLKQYNITLSTQKLPEDKVAMLTVKVDRTQEDITNLKKKLRIKE